MARQCRQRAVCDALQQGFQKSPDGGRLVAQQLGGDVRETGEGEYGRTQLERTGHSSVLFGDLATDQTVWMSHGNAIVDAPPGFTVTGSGFADTMTGGSGNDTFIGFVGADTITGGAGTDTIVLTATSATLI